jgi:hypothetical protein
VHRNRLPSCLPKIAISCGFLSRVRRPIRLSDVALRCDTLYGCGTHHLGRLRERCAAFGALAHIYPVLVLHAMLLPVNIVRLMQVVVSDQEAAAAVTSIMLAPLLGVIRRPEAKQLKIAEWRRCARERRELPRAGRTRSPRSRHFTMRRAT